MRIAEQKLLLRWWKDYAGDQPPSNTLLREFYVDVVRPSHLYSYGIVFEVFDLLTNGVAEASEPSVPEPEAQAPTLPVAPREVA